MARSPAHILVDRTVSHIRPTCNYRPSIIFDRCPRHNRGSHRTWFSRIHIETFFVGCVISSSALIHIASHCIASRRAQRMDCDREYRNLCESERLCEQAIRQVQQRSNTGE